VFYSVAVRDLKRLENITRAPIFSFITTTVSGLTTIHAYGKEHEFITK
jgi:ATP-binding cassette subfamily C (CFTR/MRP) protein 5